MDSMYEYETIQSIKKNKFSMQRYESLIDWFYKFTIGMQFPVNVFYLAAYNLNRFINKYEITNDILLASAMMYLTEVFIINDVYSSVYKQLIGTSTIDEFNEMIKFIFYGLNYNLFYITSHDFIKLQKNNMDASIYSLSEYINLLSTVEPEIYYHKSSTVASSSIIISKFIVVDSTFSADGKYFIERIEYLLNNETEYIKQCISVLINSIYKNINRNDLLILNHQYKVILQENKELLKYLDEKIKTYSANGKAKQADKQANDEKHPKQPDDKQAEQSEHPKQADKQAEQSEHPKQPDDEKQSEQSDLIKINYNDMEELLQTKTLKKISSGTYGDIFIMDKIFVLKKHKVEAVISQSLLRESAIIYILNKFPHYNLIRDAKIIYNHHSYYTIMPYYGVPIRTDLNLDTRSTIFQILSAVTHLHKFGIVHRDITMNNILIKNGVITLIDYGMSDFIIFDNVVSSPVCTITFRPIEILLGHNKFCKEQDIWSVGCIMLFLLCKNLILFGYHEIEQIFSIYSVLGFPKAIALKNLPHFKNTYPKWENNLKKYIAEPIIYDIVYQMLNYNFYNRISAQQALKHKYFM